MIGSPSGASNAFSRNGDVDLTSLVFNSLSALVPTFYFLDCF